jgi:integrase
MTLDLLIPSSPTIDFSAIERADLQPSTKEKYTRAIDNMMQSGVDPFDYPALSAYADTLSQSSRGFLKAALSIITDGELTRIKAQATPGNIGAIQALVARLEAMDKAIPIHEEKGTKTHTWLSRQQVEQITSLPDLSTTRGLRDYIVLATLLGAGIRREEMTSLSFSDLLQQPTGGGMRDVLRIRHGKGDKRRTIPISAKLARHLREWHRLAGDGLVARAVNKAGDVNGSLSTRAVYDIVAK